MRTSPATPSSPSGASARAMSRSGWSRARMSSSIRRRLESSPSAPCTRCQRPSVCSDTAKSNTSCSTSESPNHCPRRRAFSNNTPSRRTEARSSAAKRRCKSRSRSGGDIRATRAGFCPSSPARYLASRSSNHSPSSGRQSDPIDAPSPVRARKIQSELSSAAGPAALRPRPFVTAAIAPSSVRPTLRTGYGSAATDYVAVNDR